MDIIEQYYDAFNRAKKLARVTNYYNLQDWIRQVAG